MCPDAHFMASPTSPTPRLFTHSLYSSGIQLNATFQGPRGKTVAGVAITSKGKATDLAWMPAKREKLLIIIIMSVCASADRCSAFMQDCCCSVRFSWARLLAMWLRLSQSSIWSVGTDVDVGVITAKGHQTKKRHRPGTHSLLNGRRPVTLCVFPFCDISEWD